MRVFTLFRQRSVAEIMEACVAAGLAVRRADREAGLLRTERLDRRDAGLSAEEERRLAALEADAARLSKVFVAAQGPLREAGPALFQQRLAEVNRRIAEQLARAT